MLGKAINRSSSKSRERDKSVDKNKSRYSQPEPVFMSNQQLGAYLTDLRSNRPARPTPTGARPLPHPLGSSGNVQSLRRNFEPQDHNRSATASTHSPIRPNTGSSPNSRPERDTSSPTKPRHGHSANSGSPTQQRRFSHHRRSSSSSSAKAAGALPGNPALRSLVSITSGSEEDINDHAQSSPKDSKSRNTSGTRWMEKQEARSIRLAMQELDQKGVGNDAIMNSKKDQESKLDKRARDEADELITLHQQRHRPHSRNGVEGRKFRDSTTGDSSASSSRYPSDSSTRSDESFASSSFPKKKFVKFSVPASIPGTDTGDSEKPSSRDSNDGLKTSSGSFGTTRPRSGSGSSLGNILPLHLRNPFSRAKNARQSAAPQTSSTTENNRLSQSMDDTPELASPSRLDKFEIHRNPPTQSKDPKYVANSPSAAHLLQTEPEQESPGMKMRDGKEVRGDDIRMATSKSFKDRSPKLPTPTAVSSKPGRPIISFNNEWKPRNEDANEGADRPLKYASSSPTGVTGPNTSVQSSIASMNKESNRKMHNPTIPIISLPEEQYATHKSVPNISISDVPDRPKPSIPVINLPDEQPRSTSIPSIHVYDSGPSKPQIPTIVLPNDPAPSGQFNIIPSISVTPSNPPTPSISIGPPIISVSPPSISVNSIPTINISDNLISSSTRPLPTPTASKHSPRKSKGYGPPPPSSIRSAASATPSNPFSRFRSSTALCTACALPIGGRIVTAVGSRFHPDCFRCFHCSEALECVAFYPEPETTRTERLERIRARQRGTLLPQYEQPGKTEVEDGDETQVRFYCHLDFHEFFSPRCKNCTTPIEGDVIVALGATWHAGHFFCAQCGDPFESSTPFVEKEGYAWCIECHAKRFSGKCAKCKRPVSDTVVQAMEREWHESCFCCAECKGPFEDGRYFIRHGSEDEPVCSACEAKRLKA